MAGGRRPASYVAGVRHNTGVERATPQTYAHQMAMPPVEALSNGSSLPPWIPSIWQPAPEKPAPSESRATLTGVGTGAGTTTILPRPTDATSMLAAALDSAVQSAVMRALEAAPNSGDGLANGERVRTPTLTASSASSDTGLDDDSSSSPLVLSLRERELWDKIHSLEQRLSARDDDVLRLTERLGAMEQRVTMETDDMRKQQSVVANLASKLHAASLATTERNNLVDSRLSTLTEMARVNSSAVRKNFSLADDVAVDAAATSTRLRQLAQDVEHLRGTLVEHIERADGRLGALEATCNDTKCRLADVIASGKNDSKDEEKKKEDADDVKKSVLAVMDNVTSMRSKLKRVESQLTDVEKHMNETAALRDGFEDGVQTSVQHVQEVVSTLSSKFDSLDKEFKLKQKRSQSPNDHSDLNARTDTLESNVKSLKKLIESNMRNQLSAEGIVKEQVSLITKHVCMAMRQYTSRRISENNALIDQALRARIPEYAENEGQFVLVREELANGSEKVDIQKASDLATESAPSSEEILE